MLAAIVSPQARQRYDELMAKAAEKQTRKHDPVYRRIFNRAQIIEEILKRFATGPWAGDGAFVERSPIRAILNGLARTASRLRPAPLPGRPAEEAANDGDPGHP